MLYLVFSEVLGALGVFIGLALVGWGGFVAWRVRREPGVLGRWGLRREGLGPALAATSTVAALALATMAALGAHLGQLRLDPHMLPLLALYPVWGLVQQLLVQGLVARNLAHASGWAGNPLLVTLVAASLFGLVHVRSPLLAGGTFVLGLAFTPIYLRWRNLWPLGLYHGWLGVFFYFWVLGRDPWRYVVGS